MTSSKVFHSFAMLVFLIGHAGVAHAQSTFPLTVSGRTATAVIDLPGGYAADLTLEFDDVVELHSGALELTARVLSPFDVLALQPRLPAGAAATIPPTFPVLFQIEPTPSSALALSGVVTISLHTHNLTLDVALPWGLYSASAGGPFRDITQSVGIGSYRVDGSTGGFSEFVLAADQRPLPTIIGQKFDALQGALTQHASSIAPSALAALQSQLNLAESLYTFGLVKLAIAVIGGFSYFVDQQSGSGIPDVWRAHDDAVNVAGILRERATTLRFSLILAANQQP
jgi:hypothetical protein